MKNILLLLATVLWVGSVSVRPAIASEPASAADSSSNAATTKPNIIFMLTDDMGYSDVGCYGATKVETPHIDQLAAEGIKFTDFHTAASICSPSRAAFLTGAYPQRAGLYMGINPIRTAHWFLGLHPDEITIAEHLNQQRYATHQIGKWHLGTEPEFLPRKQGFDSCYGMLSNAGHSKQFFDNDQVIPEDATRSTNATLYRSRDESHSSSCGKERAVLFVLRPQLSAHAVQGRKRFQKQFPRWCAG